MHRFIGLVNNIITHPRDKVKDFGIRTLMHIPVGFLMGMSPIPGDKFVDLFIFYQMNEDRHTEDQAWKDVNGALIGFALGRVTLFGLVGVFVWKIITLFI